MNIFRIWLRTVQTGTVVAMVGAMALQAFAQDLPQAIRKIQNQEYAAARKDLAALLEKSRKPEMYYYYGLSYLQEAEQEEDKAVSAGKIEESKKWFEQGIERSAKFALNYAGLGRYYVLTGNNAQAKVNLEKALSLQSDDVGTLMELAESWLLMGREGLDQATLLLKKAEVIDGNNPRIHLLLGETWFAQNVEELPLAEYKRALELDPKNVEALYRMGQYYVKYKQWQQGGEALMQAIQMDNSFAPAYQELGELYFRAKKYPEAREYYRKYVTLREAATGGAKDISARYRYAQFLYLSKDYKAAVEEINLVMKENPSNVLLRLLVYSNFEMGNVADAKAAQQKYFASISPKYLIARDFEYRGKIAIKEGRVKEGIDDVLKAIEMDNSLTPLYQEVVTLLTREKRYLDAVALQRRAVANDPSVNTYYTLASLFYKFVFPAKMRVYAPTGDRTKLTPEMKDTLKSILMSADSAYRAADAKRPNFLPIVADLARVNAEIDPETELGLAKPFYEKVIELASADPVKNKEVLVEANFYLAYFNFNVVKDNKKAFEYVQKVLQIDPEYQRGKELGNYLQKLGSGSTGNR